MESIVAPTRGSAKGGLMLATACVSMAAASFLFNYVFSEYLLKHYHGLIDKTVSFAIWLATQTIVGVLPVYAHYRFTTPVRAAQDGQALGLGLWGRRGMFAMMCTVCVLLIGIGWVRLPKTDSEILWDLRSAPAKVMPRDFVALANRGVVDALPYLIEFMEQQNSEMRWYALRTVSVLAKQPAFEVSVRTDPAAKESALRSCIKWWRESTNSSEEAK